MTSSETPLTDRPVVPTPPSIHVRAIITWLAIFPLVAIGMTIMSPFTIEWHPRSPFPRAHAHRRAARGVPGGASPPGASPPAALEGCPTDGVSGPRSDGWSAGKGLEPSEAKVSNHLTPVRRGTS